MKILSIILKLLTASIVFFVTATFFMLVTSTYLPRLGGANYYYQGCSDGVTDLLIQLDYDKIKDKEAVARTYCDMSTQKLREKGYLR